MSLGTNADALFTLLATTPVALCAGGTQYATGWPGLTREKFSLATDNEGNSITIPIPSNGYINIFDRPFTKDSQDARPGIYRGTAGNMMSDEQDGKPVITTGGYVEYRAMVIPIVIVASNSNYYTTEQMLFQLRANVKAILQANIVTTYWWRMCMPGMTGGGNLSERLNMSGTGGLAPIAEGTCVLPVRIQYQWNSKTAPA